MVAGEKTLAVCCRDKGGSDLFDRLREINSSVKVLLARGYCIDGFIQKLFSVSQLSMKIREILG